MPSLVLETNVKVTEIKSFVLEFSKFSANLLEKPEKYISISYRYNEHLTFAGTLEPAFLLVITSLDNITPERNEAYSNALFTFLKDKFGLQGDRGYITFYDPGRANLGYQGTTFAQIFGK
ncbi:Tautomerase/MIF [Russula ochroleuca]|jgi:phenylpyruvate tautomerase|uniref:L-dopachrome isomerase n=1 Tax=Russula ochroleuca TaxID=152965 RepID=A0A9P5MUU0_9AGAM|nr:Tautomerase/MIF [Russula ochroleuca]